MVLLSFDTEEFDLPRESGVDISIHESMKVSETGTNIVLDVLKSENVKATFFCTSTFAERAPKTMHRIIDEGHEVASHGCDHWKPKESDVEKSKQILQKLTNLDIYGYRQPRMFPVSDEEIERQGYTYNSSLHPAFIPGRYMHLNCPRKPFMKGNVLQIPASVTPFFRFPVFWLACHNYPWWLYKLLCMWTFRRDELFVIYFHPWEFIQLNKHREWRIPWIIKHNAGEVMISRLSKLIEMFKDESAEFGTYTEFTNQFRNG